MSVLNPTAGVRRSAWAAALLAVTLFAGLVPAASASAGPARPASAAYLTGACGKAHKAGVTVVVDFSKFKKGVKVRCDKTRPASGLAALKAAGFSYAFVPRVPGFVCRVAGWPRKCNGAPSTAYWSYWQAKPGGKWVYSKIGAAAYHPKSGQVEGWAFGKGKPPSVKAP